MMIRPRLLISYQKLHGKIPMGRNLVHLSSQSVKLGGASLQLCCPPARREIVLAPENSYPQAHPNGFTRKAQFSVDSSVGVVKIPRGSFQERARFLLNDIPLGSLSNDGQAVCEDIMMKISTSKDRVSSASAVVLEQLLERLVAEATVNSSVRLTAVPYCRVIRTWARASDPNGFRCAYSVFQRMQARYEEDQEKHPAPNHHAYSSVMFACTTSPDKEAVDLAEELMRSIETRASKDPSSPVVPTAEMFNNIILAHANQADKRYGAATAAEDWLMHMSRGSTDGGPTPTTRSFNRVLKAWSIAPEEKGADRALEILELMLRLYLDSHEQACPDTYSFHTVISAFGKRGRARETERVLEMAIKFFSENKVADRVDLTECLNATMISWSNSNDENILPKVKALFDDFNKLATQEGLSHVVAKPNPDSYVALIRAYAVTDRLTEADECVRTIVKSKKSGVGVAPTSGMFREVIRGWRRLGTPAAAERAESLLDLQLEVAERHGFLCAPDRETFFWCIDMWCKLKQGGSAGRALRIFNLADQRNLSTRAEHQSLIHALCRERNVKNYVEAARLLRRMEKKADEGKLEWPSHASTLYSLVLKSLARVGTLDAGETALDILREMKTDGSRSARPSNSGMYTSVARAFLKIPGHRSAQVAFEIFEDMRLLDKDPDSPVRLDRVAFIPILHALSRGGNRESADKACKVLAYMMRLHSEGRPELEPSVHCYDSCLGALLNTRDSKYLEKSVKLLTLIIARHKDRGLTYLPSAAAINAIAHMCHTAQGTEQLQEQVRRVSRYIHSLSNKQECAPSDHRVSA